MCRSTDRDTVSSVEQSHRELWTRLIVVIVVTTAAAWSMHQSLIVGGLISFAHAETQADLPPGPRGRVEIASVGLAFTFVDVRAKNKHTLGPWDINEAAHFMAVCGASADEWTPCSFSFVPERSGDVSVVLCGDWYDNLESDHRSVWVDVVSVEGANIENGGFEDIGEDGNPVAWQQVNPAPIEEYSTNDSRSRSGGAAVKVWHDSGISQVFEVEAWNTYVVKAYFKADS